MKKFTPLGDRVLILPDVKPQKTTGLAAPPSQKEKPTEGIVVAVGPFATMAYCMTGVCVNWRVQFAKYAGRETEHMGAKHLLMRLEEIEGRIEDVEA